MKNLQTTTYPLTVTVKTNDPEYMREGTPQEDSFNVKGYWMVLFEEEGCAPDDIHGLNHGIMDATGLAVALRNLPPLFLIRVLEELLSGGNTEVGNVQN